MCPVTVPYYIPKFSGQSNGEWMAALAYKRKGGSTDPTDVNSYEVSFPPKFPR